jgi:Ricin-type beta-trefoil lectin domain-like
MLMSADGFPSHGAHASVFVTTFVLLVGALGAARGQATDAKNPQAAALCKECLRIRVGVPLVARGPAPNIADNWFTEIQLPNGKFRGFTAGGNTFAVDGDHPYDMGGAAATVFSPDVCGKWIQHVELEGKILFGWVHNETSCGRPGTNYTSMTIATSNDYGLHWKIEGPIITSPESPAEGKAIGDSCAAVVRGNDGYDYAYCLHNGEGGWGFVARAPASDPSPGKWKKYFNGAWSEPGVVGKSSPVDGLGVAWWTTTKQTLGINWVKGGMGLQASDDRVHFTQVFPQPLMLTEYGDWSRKNGLELHSYPVLIDLKTGLNQLSDHWLLAYMYLSPGEDFGRRYLVFRPVDISWSRAAGEPQVGEMLTHWYSASQHDHWATIAPVPGNYLSYRPVAQLGYIMTAPDPSKPTVELEECVSQSPGRPDHILTEKGVCETHDYKRLRSAGFIYSAAQPNTQSLYRCYSETEKSHFASSHEDCDDGGKLETLLGYVLKASIPSSASIGGKHRVASQATGLCFNIRGNTNNSGEAIIPWPCGRSTNMEFNFVDQGSGFYSIHTLNGTQDLCLNISTAVSSPGDGKKYGGAGNLIQWSCSGSSLFDNELFELVDLGGGRQQIRVKNSGLCLEDPGSGGTIRQNVCSSSPNQTFTLIE